MKNIFVLALMLLSFLSFAQTKKEINLKEGSIKDKFDLIYTNSNNFKDYKVIKSNLFIQLKNYVLDSLKKQKEEFTKATEDIKYLQEKIDKQSKEIGELQQTITNLQAEKDQISFIGIPVEKSRYQFIMWSLVSLLILFLIYFIYRFKNSIQTTQAIKQNIEKLDEEYNTFRTNALEREQLLKRQLLDEKKKYQS